MAPAVLLGITTFPPKQDVLCISERGEIQGSFRDGDLCLCQVWLRALLEVTFQTLTLRANRERIYSLVQPNTSMSPPGPHLIKLSTKILSRKLKRNPELTR